jgi:hypothetical protein
MFGNKDAKNWNSVKANLRKIYGENLTDAELVDKLMNLKATEVEDEDDDQDDEQEESKPEKTKTKKKAEKEEDTEEDEDDDDDDDNDEESDENPSDIKALNKQIASLNTLLKTQGEDIKRLTNRVQGLEKAPGRKATGGERDLKETLKKGQFKDTDAPVW